MNTQPENVLLIDANRLSMVGYIDALKQARWKVAQRSSFEDCESYLESHSNSLSLVILGSPFLQRSGNDCWNPENDLEIVISHFIHLQKKWPDLLFVFLTPYRESELWNAISSNDLIIVRCLVFQKMATSPDYFADRISHFADLAANEVTITQKLSITRRASGKKRKKKK